MSPLFYLITTILTLVMYVLYNALFFDLVLKVLAVRPARWKTHVAACIANFTAFFFLSATELPLAFNWTFIALLFALEIKVIYRVRWTDCVFGALIGATIGLAGTLIARSTCALMLNIPLSEVNNDVSSIKAIPVAAGFLLAAITMRGVNTPRNQRILETIRGEQRVVRFLLVEISLCYLYLCLNLLLYYSDLNSLVIKLWSLKTALFVSLGIVLSLWFAYRTASVFGQARRRSMLAREIERDQKTNLQLKELAEHDELTGCFTRSYAKRKLDELLQEGAAAAVVFADVDKLKMVNDRFGHKAGDVYLAATANALDQARASTRDFVARYGGDEFLVVLTGPLPTAHVAERMSVATRSLRASGRDEDLPYEPSISWGLALPQEGENAESVIARADKEMYRTKHTSC
ncbi:diguanylate cyclase domain-containing protein [Eggerthella sp. YY7918]|uniref:GGDEF domain-containing protein n=1 Tax=Eggerthella sp. (strain YY7918) TaxID=502558 RepID=UPI000217186C|nr:diguanylate cyclase [Eggerthella sp. YY7918]BAK45675.1 hypothetical protein EGYY_26760 [Eggerthella sp. YY7918]